MTRFTNAVVTSSVAGLLAMMSGPRCLAQGEQFENPGLVPVSKILPSGMQSSQNYRVMENANADEMLYTFSMWTPWAWYRPGSMAMLQQRINEARAMAALTQMQQDPMFLNGIVDQTGQTVKAAGNAVLHPFQTIRNIPLGLEKFGQSVQAQANEGPVAGESGSRIDAKAKRKLAVGLGVDPYSANPQLQQMLNTVASVQNAGALVARVGTAFVGGGTGAVLKFSQMSGNMQQRLQDESAAELQQDNRQALTQMGCDRGRIDSFLNAKGYTATHCTYITEALQGLSSVNNICRYLTFVKSASSPEVPLYFQTQIQMALAFHRRVQPLVSFDVVGATPVFTDGSGTRHIFAPLDYLFWNQAVYERVKRMGGNGDIHVYIAGTASDTAKEKLKKYNVVVREKACDELF